MKNCINDFKNVLKLQWSYGVLLWEMFTFGAEPYQGFENIEIPDYLRSGRRLHKPLVAPDMM